MFTDLVRRSFKWILDPLSKFLAWAGVSPNTLTVIGFLLNVGVAYILSTGNFFWGAIAVLAAGAFDGLDGALARQANQVTKFGAFLDSTVDRYSESVILLGLLIYYGRQPGALTQVILIYATVVGSLLVSYTRARAEGLGIECKDGLLTRVERVVVLFFFLLINQVPIGLWILGILVNLTALQRIYVVWRKTNDGADRP